MLLLPILSLSASLLVDDQGANGVANRAISFNMDESTDDEEAVKKMSKFEGDYSDDSFGDSRSESDGRSDSEDDDGYDEANKVRIL